MCLNFISKIKRLTDVILAIATSTTSPIPPAKFLLPEKSIESNIPKTPSESRSTKLKSKKKPKGREDNVKHSTSKGENCKHLIKDNPNSDIKLADAKEIKKPSGKPFKLAAATKVEGEKKSRKRG